MTKQILPTLYATKREIEKAINQAFRQQGVETSSRVLEVSLGDEVKITFTVIPTVAMEVEAGGVDAYGRARALLTEVAETLGMGYGYPTEQRYQGYPDGVFGVAAATLCSAYKDRV